MTNKMPKWERTRAKLEKRERKQAKRLARKEAER